METHPQTPEQKIDSLFRIFTGCYGITELKEGQDLGFIRRSWLLNFGNYPWRELLAAATDYMGDAKWQRWPSAGEFKEKLKHFHYSPETVDEHEKMPPEWQRDRNSFLAWWESIPLTLPEMYKRDEIFSFFMQGEQGSFTILAVKAYRDGILHKWPEIIKEYSRKRLRAIELRRKAIAHHGIYYANTHSLTLDELEQKLSEASS